jgi:serine/threonine protein kinase
MRSLKSLAGVRWGSSTAHSIQPSNVLSRSSSFARRSSLRWRRSLKGTSVLCAKPQRRGRLSHPNIVTVYDLGQERNLQYIAMEIVPGASLDMLLKDGKQLSCEEIVHIVRQVAGAFDHANTNGIVHRDIKPGNILVRPDGVVKVTDFGIARIASQTITKTGTSMGTPAYMAPEQLKGSRVDARADQYSLGVIAYQLLGCKLPFVASSDHALMYQIVNDVPASLREVNPQLPAEADRVIRRALAKHADQRFDSCAEFSAALDVALNVRPIQRPKPIPHPDRTESEAFFFTPTVSQTVTSNQARSDRQVPVS